MIQTHLAHHVKTEYRETMINEVYPSVHHEDHSGIHEVHGLQVPLNPELEVEGRDVRRGRVVGEYPAFQWEAP